MKRVGIAIGVVVAAVILFLFGLKPAESILTRGDPDSYILIGVGRVACWVAGACEFALGAALAAGVCWLGRRKKITEPESGHVCK